MAERQKRTFNDVDAEPAEDDVRPTKRRKARTSINHLSELRPGTLYQLVGQYGGPENLTYVIQITVDGKVFQGVGPSKKKSKLMAAEFALVHLGAIAAVTDPVPDISQEPYCYEDFTADINDTNSLLYYDFNQTEPSHEQSACIAGDGNRENVGKDENSFESKMIGKNTLTILRELHPNAFYHFVASITEDARTRFIMAVNVDGQKFKGSGINKRLAKARAAREALRNLDKMEFGMAEDGMPVYEGDEKIWLEHKAKLEKEAEAKLENSFDENPVQQLNEYFPEAVITFSDTDEKPDIASFFVCQVVVEGTTYEGSGLSKKDAKSHAAALALNDLKEKGVLEEKDQEFEAKRLEREEKKKANEKLKPKENTERKAGGFKTAVAKLNDSFQNLEYKLIAETPLRNTCITAFTMAINIRGKNYVGVGKNKKMAKLDAAEKALRNLGMWSDEDEAEKVRMKKEEENLEVEDNEKWGPMQGQSHPMGWVQGSADAGWGGGTNWDVKNSQYPGYGCSYDAGWGYGGGGGYGQGMAVQQGVWGQMDPNMDGGYNAYQPMMQELNVIMGNMFESTFGQNPWKANSDGGDQYQGRGWGFGGRPGRGFQSRGSFSNRGNIGGNGQFGSKPVGLNLPETSSSVAATFSSSVNSVASAGDTTMAHSEPYRGRGSFGGRGNFRGGNSSRGKVESSSGDFSKYSNFRSAGFETGFKPALPNQTAPTQSNSETNSSLATPTYGPYGTPVAPPSDTSQVQSEANFPKSGFPVGNTGISYEAVGSSQTAGISGTANHMANTFQGSSCFSMGSTGNTSHPGNYQSGSSDGYQASGMNNARTGQYQDFMSSYQMTPSSEGFPTGNSAGSFQVDNTAASGYSSGSYSSGMTSYPPGNSDMNYSSQPSAYGNQASASNVQSTGYTSNQSEYSVGSYQDGNASRTGYAGGNFQGNTGDGAYSSANSSAGYYGMYGSGYDQGYNYNYDTTGSYNTNMGYAAGNYQNPTNSGYGYGYSSTAGSDAATDSYSTVANKTNW